VAPFPAVNLWTDRDHALVTTEIPGVNPENVDLSVENDNLTISGSREPEPMGEEDRIRRRERGSGEFSRTVELPFPVEREQVAATYADGVLKVKLPRSEASKPKKIEIQG
jgi:HSP20 family protein